MALSQEYDRLKRNPETWRGVDYMIAHLCIVFRQHKSESMCQSRFWLTGTLHSEKVHVSSVYSVGSEPQKGSQMPNGGSEDRDIQEGGTGSPQALGTSIFSPALSATPFFWLRQGKIFLALPCLHQWNSSRFWIVYLTAMLRGTQCSSENPQTSTPGVQPPQSPWSSQAFFW